MICSKIDNKEIPGKDSITVLIKPMELPTMPLIMQLLQKIIMTKGDQIQTRAKTQQNKKILLQVIKKTRTVRVRTVLMVTKLILAVTLQVQPLMVNSRTHNKLVKMTLAKILI